MKRTRKSLYFTGHFLKDGERRGVDEPETWQCFHFLECVSNIAFIFDCFRESTEFLGLFFTMQSLRLFAYTVCMSS